MRIVVCINEESLQGQLCNNVADAINNLLGVINALASNRGIELSIITSSAIFSKQVCVGTGLTQAQLDKADHDLFMAFKGMLDKGKYWDKDVPLQISSAYYLYKQHSVNSTSVAEARELVDLGEEAMIISFPGSNYTGTILSVEKDGIRKDIPHAMSTTGLFDILAGKGIVLKYDRTKYLRPDDKQTILSDATQFEETAYRVQGRTVYERIGKDEYWYVDNLHKDGSAHLEVYRVSDGLFLGTCDIEDVTKFKMASQRERAKKGHLKF